MKKRFYFETIIAGLLISVCSNCTGETDHHSSSGNNASSNIEVFTGTDLQNVTQKYRKIMEGGDEIGKMTKMWYYGEGDVLKHFAVYDNSGYNTSTKQGKIKATLFSDETKSTIIGTVLYTYKGRTFLMETYDINEKLPEAAEYIEYADDDRQWYTKYCRYLPQEKYAVECYRTSSYYPSTWDYKEEIDFQTEGLFWDSSSHQLNSDFIGSQLPVLELVKCEYNTTLLDGTSNCHQWIKEIRTLNSPSDVGGANLRKYCYVFFWNKDICGTTHFQQDSYELNSNNEIKNVNEVIRKAFSTFGTSVKPIRKSWISGLGDTVYYESYQYSLEPDSLVSYYQSNKRRVNVSETAKQETPEEEWCSFHYENENGTLFYEEKYSTYENTIRSTTSENQSSIAPKRNARGNMNILKAGRK